MFAQFKTQDGRDVWINPYHVVSIRPSETNAAVTWISTVREECCLQGPAWQIRNDLEKVLANLQNEDK